MVSPIPIKITTKSGAYPPPPKRGSQVCSGCENRPTRINTKTGNNDDTPPISPISTRAPNKLGYPSTSTHEECSCPTPQNDGYRISHQMEFTPPRSPPKMGHLDSSAITIPSGRGHNSGYASSSSYGSSGYSSSAYALGESGASSTTSLLSFPQVPLKSPAQISISSSQKTASASSTPTTTGSIASVLSKQLPLPAPYAPDGDYKVEYAYKMFGTGAWSTVRPATLTSADDNTSEIVAVKLPNTSASIPILYHEATILSYLTPSRNSISFLGYDLEQSSILLPALPLTMEEFVTQSSKRINSEEEISLATMRCPVVGMRQWLFWAQELTLGFIELKKKGVVHGDVKAGNVLLEEVESLSDPAEQAIWFPTKIRKPLPALYRPVIVDFSSSLVVGRSAPAHPTYTPPNKKVQEEAEKGISALTIPYCAPELLERFLAKDPESVPPPVPTFSSDLYSLSMTILTAAIGSDPYSYQKGVRDSQKAMFVKSGNPIGFARGDERGLRCSKGGVVEEVLEGCFGREDVGRTEVEEVSRRVKDVVRRWVEEEGWDDSRWGTQ